MGVGNPWEEIVMSQKDALLLLGGVRRSHAKEQVRLLLFRDGADLGNTRMDIPPDFFLQDVFRTITDFRALAELFEVAAVANPAHAHMWSGTVVRALTIDDDTAYSKTYVLGALLGLFRVGTWLARNWEVDNSFDYAFPTELPPLLLSDRIARIELSDDAAIMFGGLLTGPVRGWLYGHDSRKDEHSRRVWAMLHSIDDMMCAQSPRSLGDVSRIVINKLSVAFMCAMTPEAQVHALRMWHDGVAEAFVRALTTGSDAE